MTLRERRLAIGGLGAAAVVAVMMARNGSGPSEAVVAPASGSGARAAARDEAPVADVRLELLQRSRPDLEEAQRNLFRFQGRPAPPESPRPRVQPPTLAPPPAPMVPPVIVPAGPAPPPPIPVRFIGLVDAPTQGGRIAILSDGRGNVFYGKEGDIIEGRYKVLKVGPDAMELSYLDDRGHQTIRLSGQ